MATAKKKIGRALRGRRQQYLICTKCGRCLPPRRSLNGFFMRLRQLRYDFLQSDRASEIGLRFTLSVPGAHTAIPGTTNPEHFLENAKYAAEGPLPGAQFDAIRSTWSKVSAPSWIGQI